MVELDKSLVTEPSISDLTHIICQQREDLQRLENVLKYYSQKDGPAPAAGPWQQSPPKDNNLHIFRTKLLHRHYLVGRKVPNTNVWQTSDGDLVLEKNIKE